MRRLLLIGVCAFSLESGAQTIFWTEDFNNNCNAGCQATTYAGPNGAWTQTITGVEGADPNMWYVSCAENGHTPTICGTGCVPASPTATGATLHVGSNPNSLGDLGAAYDAGGLCGFFTCPQTNRRIESPVINCTGQSNITLAFNYIETGAAPNDDASVWYNSGAGWTLLTNTPATNNTGCGGQGRWTAFSFTLPASCNNNPNVRIGFLWVNNDDGVGTDPSFAVDDITLSITSAAPPVSAFTASATSVCVGQTVNFTDASTGSPNAWTWTFPSATPATASTQNVTGVVWNTAGTYTVTLNVSNANGSNSSTQVITVNANPVVAASSANQVICQGNPVTLNASGASTYVWNPGNLTGASVSVTPAATTTYTLTGTNAAGCQDTAQITIIVQPCAAPVASFTASATSVCVGQPVNFTDNSTGGPTGWTWTFPSATPASAATQNVTGVVWNTAGTYTVTLDVSNANGNNSTTQVITVNAAPNVTASASNTSVCAGTAVSLNAVGANTYVWLPGNIPNSSITVTPAATTTYTVAGTNAAGCVDTALVTISVFSLPTVTASANPVQVCSGQSTALTGSGAQTYVWNPGNINGPSVNVTPASTTTYTVTGTDANGCSNTSQLTVNVIICAVPVASASASSTEVCEGSCLDFTDASTGNPNTWAWQFPGASPATSTQQNPQNICYNNSGTYTVTLIATNTYGSDTTTLVITVNAPTPVDAGAYTTIAIGNSTQLNATGGTGSYSWSPQTGLSNSTFSNPVASPTVTTTYTVSYTNADGCTSTDTVTVEVIEAYDLYVPSAFSPNGTGSYKNEVLYVYGAGVKTLTFMVFDRYGEKVFESTSLSDGWDGTYKEKPMNTGIYVYYVKAEFYNGDSKVLKGDVTLVR